MLTELLILQWMDAVLFHVPSCTHPLAPTPSHVGWSMVAFHVHLPTEELCSSQLTLFDIPVSCCPESCTSVWWHETLAAQEWVSAGQWAVLVLFSLLSTACSRGGKWLTCISSAFCTETPDLPSCHSHWSRAAAIEASQLSLGLHPEIQSQHSWTLKQDFCFDADVTNANSHNHVGGHELVLSFWCKSLIII